MYGRTPDFHPDYPDQLVDHMAEGKSFESFAGKIRVGRTTIYSWLNMYPEFQYAKDVGTAANLDFWENAGIEGINKTGFRERHWALNMAVRHAYAGWHPEKWVGLGDAKPPAIEGGQTIDVTALSKDQLMQNVRALTGKAQSD